MTPTSTSRNQRSLPCAFAVCWSVRHSVHCTGRPSFRAMRQQDDVLRVQADLVAEAAADVVRDEAELVDAGAQRRRHPDRADPRHLVVARAASTRRCPCRTRRARPRTRAASTRSGGSGACRSSRRGRPRRAPCPRRPSRRRPTRRRSSRRRRGGRPRPSATPPRPSSTGSESYSTSISSAASRASSRVAAATAATGSPMCRTRPTASA